MADAGGGGGCASRVSPPRVLPVVLGSGATAATAAAYVIGVYLPVYNTPHTPIEGVPHAPSPSAGTPPPALTRRLMFVMMDGLSFDLARELHELSELRERGAMRMIVPPFPTYTSPAVVSFVTDLDPRDHGIRFNGVVLGAAGMDTIPAAAGATGIEVAVRSRAWQPFEQLMYPDRPGPPEGDKVLAGRVQFVWSMLARSLALHRHRAPHERLAETRALELICLGEVDEAGHANRGKSPEYLAAAHHTGALVAGLASSVDLAKDALVLVSDHGHRAAGDHGGLEPEVQRAFFLGVGSGVRRGVELGPRPPRDVAATLSLLGGFRVPTSHLGRPMLDALELADAARAHAFAVPFDHASRFACRVFPSPRCSGIDGLSARRARGDTTAIPLAESLLDGIAAERAENATARASASRRLRMALAGASTIVAGAAL
jgi:Type I phosphodiesterase / nucleotide pyrophosphatase